MADEVTVTEVVLRDGLQDYPATLSTDAKFAALQALQAAGMTQIEVTSFVRADRIPPLADADEFSARVQPASHPGYSALVPNSRGLQRALAAGYQRVVVVLSASDGHNRENLGADLAEWLPKVESLIGEARDAAIGVRAAISVAFGCPFDGDVPESRVVDLARRLDAAGVDEVSLADTIGSASPDQVTRLVGQVTDAIGSVPSLHLHTLGDASATVAAGLDAGVRHFDAALTGIGGCPYAPGAPGNLPTEELVAQLGERCALDLAAVRSAAETFRGIVEEAAGAKRPA